MKFIRISLGLGCSLLSLLVLIGCAKSDSTLGSAVGVPEAKTPAPAMVPSLEGKFTGEEAVLVVKKLDDTQYSVTMTRGTNNPATLVGSRAGAAIQGQAGIVQFVVQYSGDFLQVTVDAGSVHLVLKREGAVTFETEARTASPAQSSVLNLEGTFKGQDALLVVKKLDDTQYSVTMTRGTNSPTTLVGSKAGNGIHGQAGIVQFVVQYSDDGHEATADAGSVHLVLQRQ